MACWAKGSIVWRYGLCMERGKISGRFFIPCSRSYAARRYWIDNPALSHFASSSKMMLAANFCQGDNKLARSGRNVWAKSRSKNQGLKTGSFAVTRGRTLIVLVWGPERTQKLPMYSLNFDIWMCCIKLVRNLANSRTQWLAPLLLSGLRFHWRTFFWEWLRESSHGEAASAWCSSFMLGWAAWMSCCGHLRTCEVDVEATLTVLFWRCSRMGPKNACLHVGHLQPHASYRLLGTSLAT